MNISCIHKITHNIKMINNLDVEMEKLTHTIKAFFKGKVFWMMLMMMIPNYLVV